jgi:hypothetical protein
MVEVTIESPHPNLPCQYDPFFEGIRRKKDGGRRGCIEHDFAKGLKIWSITGTEARVVELGN